MLSAVRRSIHAAFLLRSCQSAFGADEDSVGIRRIDKDARDASRLIESHVLPGFSRIDGFVHSVAGYIAIANSPWFAGSGPHGRFVGRRDGKRSDRSNRFVVKDRLPTISAIY